MNIALDYDQCYTEDPKLWDWFIAAAKKKGHTVWVVTSRYAISEDVPFEPVSPGQMIYTGRRAKKPHCDSLGIHINIWIDDDPMFILQHHGESLAWSNERMREFIDGSETYQELEQRGKNEQGK